MEKYDRYIGSIFDNRYRINRVIGEGGMSIVFEATDLSMKRTVAVKMLKEDISHDENSVKRFISESKAVSMLSHKNIVSIYDVSIRTHLKYIVMEYVDGITLKNYINKKGALPYKDVVKISEQILSALGHAHSKKIIHRDVKPQNVILLRDGTIKVADFGIAKLPNAEAVTAVDKAIGTVYYISPEQASGKKIDIRSDIYSLGVVMYEMATGRLPFVADTTVTIALMQMSKTPVRPRDINPNIPIGLEQIILKALEKNPDNRFMTAGQMIRALEQLKQNPGIVFKSDNRQKTQTMNAVKAPPQASATQKSTRVQPKQPSGGTGEIMRKKKRKANSNSMMPIIVGVTCAFLIVLVITAIIVINSLLTDKSVNGSQTITIDTYQSGILTDELKDSILSTGYFKLNIVEKYTTDYAVDQIISQDPAPGEKRKVIANKQQCELTLVVCKGAKSFVLPDYGMQEYRTVEATLKNTYSIVCTEERVYSDTIPSGYVIYTEPAYGTEVSSGQQVKLYISKGQNASYVTVPSFTNLSEELAYRLLKSSNLKYGGATYVLTGTDAFPDRVPAGLIVGQSAVATSAIAEGSSIYFYISSGIYGEPVEETPAA